jgi:hypothetical protein
MKQGNFISRYLAGEHEQVWTEMIALGADIRKPRYKSEALEVARETMRRVEVNVRTVVARLHILHYRFKSKGAVDSPFAERLRESTKRRRQNRRAADYQIRPHVLPSADTVRHLEELEKQVGAIPLSLWAFYEIVGEVDLIGHHDTISPEADPLVVFSLEMVLRGCREEIAEEGLVPIAPDHYHKANISGGAPYEIALPDPRADAELLNEPHKLLFVDYLRLVFRHGGFPGYAGKDRDVPKEVAIPSKGLRQF